MRTPRRTTNGNERRAIAWAGAALAALAVLGLVYAPGAGIVWLVLLVFAVAAIPQALLAGRARRRR